ncbi:MAG: MFS transporter [Deltaproteobacteria bacterium]|nr:MFS transporter [Deltaproteobacteria bacterium]
MAEEKDAKSKAGAGAADFPVGGASARFTLFTVFLLYMVNYMDRQVFAATKVSMMADLGLSEAQHGFIQTVFLLLVSALALPVAVAIDRWSRRKMLALMAMWWSLATAATALMSGFGSMLGARGAVAAGEAGYSSGGTAMLSAAYPEGSRAKVMGIFNASIPLGAALGTVLGGVLCTLTGDWRTPFYVFAVPGIALGIMALFLRDYVSVAVQTAQGERVGVAGGVSRLIRIPTLVFTYLGFVMNVFISNAMLYQLPSYFEYTRGVDAAKGSKLAATVFLLALIGAPLGGFLANRWKKSRSDALLLFCALSSLLAAGLLFGGLVLHGRGLGYVLLCLWGVLTVCYLPPASAVTQDVVHPGLRAMSWGLCVFCMYLLGGAYSPWIVGALIDTFGGGARGIEQAMRLVPATGVLAALLFWAGSRHYARDAARAEKVALKAE